MVWKIATEKRHRKSRKSEMLPLVIGKEEVERVGEVKFLAMKFSEDLSWSSHVSTTVGKAQQRLFFLRKLQTVGLSKSRLTYNCVIESILTYAVCVWYESAKRADCAKLNRVIKAAEKVIGQPLPRMTDIFRKRGLVKGRKIVGDKSHPCCKFFSLLPSGKRFRCISCRTSRLHNSFIPSAVVLLNS